MNIDTTGIEYIVKKVMAEIDCADAGGKPLKDGELGVFNDMEMDSCTVLTEIPNTSAISR